MENLEQNTKQVALSIILKHGVENSHTRHYKKKKLGKQSVYSYSKLLKTMEDHRLKNCFDDSVYENKFLKHFPYFQKIRVLEKGLVSGSNRATSTPKTQKSIGL